MLTQGLFWECPIFEVNADFSIFTAAAKPKTLIGAFSASRHNLGFMLFLVFNRELLLFLTN